MPLRSAAQWLGGPGEPAGRPVHGPGGRRGGLTGLAGRSVQADPLVQTADLATQPGVRWVDGWRLTRRVVIEAWGAGGIGVRAVLTSAELVDFLGYGAKRAGCRGPRGPCTGRGASEPGSCWAASGGRPGGSEEGCRMGLRDLVYRLYEHRLEASLSPAAMPRHVGVMCDGNRRWARSAGPARRQQRAPEGRRQDLRAAAVVPPDRRRGRNPLAAVH